MSEFYYDERPGGGSSGSWEGEPQPDPGDWVPPAGSGSGGSWGGGRDPVKPVPGLPRLNRTASGALLADADGRILRCRQSCRAIPALLAFLNREDAGHGRCILVSSSDPQRPVSVSTWSGTAGSGATVAAVASWPFGGPGSYRIRAKWQRGHYDYNEISRAKFIVYGVSTGWVRLPLSGGWTTIATVVVAENFRITVNGSPGSITGNKPYLEN